MKSKITAALIVLMLATSSILMVSHVQTTEALPTPTPTPGPSLIINDTINRANATLGIMTGSQITAKGTIKNIGNTTLTNLLTGVFFIEGTGVLVPADFTFEFSFDCINWIPIDPSEVKVPTGAAWPMQVELPIGSAGGETLAPNATLTMYLRITLNNDMTPIQWPTNIVQSMIVWVYGDTNFNRQFDGGEIIYSQPPTYGGLIDWDKPVRIDLAIVHTAEIAGTGKFYYSIQDAINAASNGNTIVVYAGTYNEAVYITKSLTIRAASIPIITGSHLFATDFGDREAVIFIENAADVTLEGLDIEGQDLGPGPTKSYGVIYENSSGTIHACTISPNTVGDMYSTAVACWSGSNVLIEDCLIKNFGRVGIYTNAANATVQNNEIIGQTYDQDNLVNYGIEIEDYSGPSTAQITGNKIYNCDNTHPSPLWSSTGITVDIWRAYYNLEPSTVIIQGNNIHNNFEAIEIVSSSLSFAHYNNLYNNRYGVWTDSDFNKANATFDARFNWWGDASGPKQETTNPSGLGNDAGDYVDYSPWLGKTSGSTPMTYHVNPTGTIQEAIDEAQSGDTILVHSGTYNEALYVNKSLTIKAASTPIITGSHLFATHYGPRQAVIFVTGALNVVLNGLDIEGQGLGVPAGTKNYAIIYESSSGTVLGCTVSPNTVGDMYSAAIAAWDNSIVTVTGCTIKNFGRIGVYSNNATMGIVGNTIIGQVYNDDNLVNYGIEIEDYSGPSAANIQQNIIYNCNNTSQNPSWSSAAIIVDTWREWADVYGLTLLPSKVLITSNTIFNNYESIEIVSNEFSYAHYNNFTHNAYGVVSAAENWTTNPTYHVFDARFNWWGDASGPLHTTSWMYHGNPYGPHYGSGDAVTDYVLYDPWNGLPLPAISVQPELIQKQILNTTFTVNITISNLSEGFRAVGVQFRLCYDNALIEAVNVTEGTFMKDPRWNFYGTYFISYIENDPVYGPSVIVGILLLPNATGTWETFPYGNGTLATITFRTLMQETGLEKPPLTCALTLVNTMIINDDLEEIPHTINHGTFEMYPTNAADINHDYKVDMKDVGIAAHAFGTVPGDLRWNALADITGPITWVPDGKVDMRDIGVLARNFGWKPLDDP